MLCNSGTLGTGMKQWCGIKLAFEVLSQATWASKDSHSLHFMDHGTDSVEEPSGRITLEPEFLWLRAQTFTLIVNGIQSLVPSLFPECH